MFCRFSTSACLSCGQQAERVSAELVSGTYFTTLGIGPALGRLLTLEDDRLPSGHPVVVLNYAFWKSRFAADPSIIGKSWLVNDQKMLAMTVAKACIDGV